MPALGAVPTRAPAHLGTWRVSVTPFSPVPARTQDAKICRRVPDTRSRKTVPGESQPSQTTQTTRVLSSLVQLQTPPAFGIFYLCRSRPKRTRPHLFPISSSTSAFHRQQAWNEARHGCFRSDSSGTQGETKIDKNHGRGGHNRHRGGRHLHHRHAHNPAVQDRGMEPLRRAGEEARCLRPRAQRLVIDTMGGCWVVTGTRCRKRKTIRGRGCRAHQSHSEAEERRRHWIWIKMVRQRWTYAGAGETPSLCQPVFMIL